ncbi:MAG: PEPxxWA-CTERM sorting domain-containing protein [Sphingomonadaceae bacterium]
MRSVTKALIAATAVIGATPAMAGQVYFDNGGSNYQNSKNFTDGTVNVTATGFSINNSNLVESAWVGSWSGNGMGVLNKANDGSHTIDNQGYTDFVVLVFDQAVTLNNAYLKTGYWGGNDYYNDTDATIGFQNNSAFNISSLLGDSKSDLTSLFSTYASNSSGNGSQWHGVNSGGNTGNVWLVGAAFSNPDHYRDGFKLKALTYTIPETAVPEPAAWALMILGFGMVGGVLRRKRPTTTLTYA